MGVILYLFIVDNVHFTTEVGDGDIVAGKSGTSYILYTRTPCIVSHMTRPPFAWHLSIRI